MKAFISYSHKDEEYLQLLITHLAPLKREGLIETWSDHAVEVGQKLDDEISSSLQSSQLFIALVSPDYLASNYCYEKEFEKAIKRREEETLIIVPIIIEPCDWKNTPFAEIKGLPKDNNPVSEWKNKNMAMLKTIEGIRSLLSKDEEQWIKPNNKTKVSKSFKIKQDFDNIQKLEFLESGFSQIKKYFLNEIREVVTLDGVEAKVVSDTAKIFSALLVSRKKGMTQSRLLISSLSNEDNANGLNFRGGFSNSDYIINVKIQQENQHNSEKQFSIDFDDFHLFWKEESYQYSSKVDELSTIDICDICSKDWLESVGIVY